MWVYWIKEMIWKLCVIDSPEEVIVFITPFSCRILNSLPYLEITFPAIHSHSRCSPTYEDRETEQSSICETTLTKLSDLRWTLFFFPAQMVMPKIFIIFFSLIFKVIIGERRSEKWTKDATQTNFNTEVYDHHTCNQSFHDH